LATPVAVQRQLAAVHDRKFDIAPWRADSAGHRPIRLRTRRFVRPVAARPKLSVLRSFRPVLSQDDIRRRIRAAMALAGFTSWEQLADHTPLSRSTVKDLGTSRGHAGEAHLRVIAAACDLPYAWFTIPDIGAAIDRENDDASIGERVEALERQVAALLRRDRGAGAPAPGGELGRRATPR
jgi:hypothetical protein